MGIFNVGGRTFHPGDQGARLVHCQRLILGLAWEKGARNQLPNGPQGAVQQAVGILDC